MNHDGLNDVINQIFTKNNVNVMPFKELYNQIVQCGEEIKIEAFLTHLRIQKELVVLEMNDEGEFDVRLKRDDDLERLFDDFTVPSRTKSTFDDLMDDSDLFKNEFRHSLDEKRPKSASVSSRMVRSNRVARQSNVRSSSRLMNGKGPGNLINSVNFRSGKAFGMIRKKKNTAVPKKLPDPEDMYMEIQSLKMELAKMTKENMKLKTKTQSLESKKNRKEKQVEQLLKAPFSMDESKDTIRRQMNLIRKLKTKVKELEDQLESSQEKLRQVQADSSVWKRKELEAELTRYHNEVLNLKHLKKDIKQIKAENKLKTQDLISENAKLKKLLLKMKGIQDDLVSERDSLANENNSMMQTQKSQDILQLTKHLEQRNEEFEKRLSQKENKWLREKQKLILQIEELEKKHIDELRRASRKKL